MKYRFSSPLHTFFLVLLSGLSLFGLPEASAQAGCTDPQAGNYNAAAIMNDGSCIYAPTTLSLTRLAGLDSPLLDESSGVSFFNDQLWTHVDNTNSVIYRLDSATGLSTQEISIVNTVNTDWEDITEGNGFVFLGDFGNNYGNRTDLRIYRVEQSQFSDTSTVLVADTILFSYPDQTDFTPALNATRFDCEAFFYREDSLHLFCKDWVNKGTRHYVVPAIPGTHVAALRDSFNVNGLVTSAAVASDGAIVLLGYDNVVPAPCFLWLLYDYSGTDFFSGNKRMFSLGTALTAGQVEGVCFRNNHYGYITNERFQQFVFNIEPQLWSYDLGTFISSPITAVQDTKPQPQELSTSPNPFTTETIVQLPANLLQGSVFFLVSPDGKIIREEKIYGNEFHIQRQSLVSGIYFYRVIQPDGVVYQGKVIPD